MEANREKLFDLTELRTIAAGDDRFFQEMIRLFIEQGEYALQVIRELPGSQDFAKVKFTLHKMKPSIMVLGVKQATEIIVQVENLTLPGDGEEKCAPLLANLERILKDVTDQLNIL